MTKKLLNLMAGSLVLISSASLAQPTLTATGTNSVIGETFTYYNNSNYVPPGNSGASQTWDLSAMTGTSGGLTTVVAPGATPNGASFPGSNIAWDNPTAGTVNYFSTSASAFQNFGVVAPGPTLIPNTTAEDFMRFPCTFNSTFSDAWTGQWVNQGMTFYRRGVTTVTADSYGTLITPNGTYTNVMRIHMVEAYQDSANVGAPYIITYNNDEYLWYKEGIHLQLATEFTLNTSVGGPYTGGTYAFGNVGIDKSSDLISSYTLFPNPAVDKLNIAYTLTKNKTVEVVVFNSMGQKAAMDQTAKGLQGQNTAQVDISALPAGPYYAQIMLDGTLAATRRFMVSK